MSDEPRRTVTIDDIRKAKPKVIAVDVEEWGGKVYLRRLSADVGLELQESTRSIPEGKPEEVMFMLLGQVLAKEDGSQMFETQEEARQLLGAQEMQLLSRLQDQALEWLGWTKLAEAEIKNASGGAADAASPTV